MNNQELMTRSDKLKYFGDKFKNILIYTIYFLIILNIFLFLGFKLILHDNLKDTELYFYGLNILVIVVMILKLLKILNILLRKNIFIVNGYISKKHRFKKNDSDNFTSIISKAKATSDDKSITTKWIRYPNRYFKLGKPKVKIIVYKNKAIDFYLNR